MSRIVRLGDTCSGHGSYPKRKSISASPNVFANGIPIVRVSDKWETHCNNSNPPSCHNGVSSTGSSTVYANSLAIVRVGDNISCGSTTATGSQNVSA